MSRRAETESVKTLSTIVIAAIAEHKGVDAMELEPPLYEAIDPDVLDALFPREGNTTGSPMGRLTFPYDGYEVRVTSVGDVRISDSDDQ